MTLKLVGVTPADAARTKAQRAEQMTARVNALRDAKINGGVVHEAVTYQSDARSRENILGVGLSAALALLLAKVDPASLRWSDGNRDFEFIAADNNRVKMTAPQAASLYRRSAKYKSDLMLHARALKDRIATAAKSGTHADLDAIEAEMETGWPA